MLGQLLLNLALEMSFFETGPEKYVERALNKNRPTKIKSLRYLRYTTLT